MQRSVGITDKVLTESQNAAIYSIDRPMAVVAGAGSGKTTVLIERCRHIIGDDWNEIDRLLAITFTEKAAGELKARLRPYVPNKDRYRIEGAWIGTFHAFCARMLRQHAPIVGLDPDFHILDENASRLITGQTVKDTLLALLKNDNNDASYLVDAVDFKTAIGALEDLSAFRWHARNALLKDVISNAEDNRILSSLSNVFSEVENRIRMHLSRVGALDFQELEIRALELLNNNHDILSTYRKKFKHILVDEFQDTNDAQTDLILILFDPKINQLCIVGDPRQSIYRFRGANIDCFTNVLKRIKAVSGESINLAENFRSRSGIVNFINNCQGALSDGLFGSLALRDVNVEREEMIPTRSDEGMLSPVIAIPISTDKKTTSQARREAEALAIAKYIHHLTTEGLAKYGDIVCLFQALTGINPYEKAFRLADIPYLMFGGRGLLNRQEICDLFSVLRYASDQNDSIAMLGILRSPLIGISDDDLTISAGENGDELTKNVLNDDRCQLLNEISSMAAHLRPSEIIKRTVSITGYEMICNKLDRSGGMTANIDRFISLAASIERQEPTPLKGFTEFIKELKQRSARLGDPPAAGDITNAVRCMTVHAAKGLEFSIVILPDLFRKMKSQGGKWQFTREHGIAFKLKDKHHPLGKREDTERYKELHKHDMDSQLAESKRLLYVAMTRAKDQLVLPVHDDIKLGDDWHSWLFPVISKCIDDNAVKKWSFPENPASPGELQTEASITSKRKLNGGKHNRIPIVDDSLTVSQLECYYRCPQEYRLRYALGIPSNELFKQRSKKLPANIFGSIIHGVLEQYRTESYEYIETMVINVCLKNNIYPNQELTDGVKKVISRFNDNELADKLEIGDREVRFDWHFEDLNITGYIDWLWDTDDSLRIVDFKTDHITEQEVEARAKEYLLQMACYGLAAEQAKGKSVESATLVFLLPSKNFTINFNEMSKDKNRKLISNIINSIRNMNYEIGDLKTPCYKCPYKHNGTCTKAT